MALLDFSLEGIGGLFTSAREAITGDKIVDPVALAKIDLQMQELENALLTGQIEVNKIEAAHQSLFVAGWRPAIGWVCAIALGYSFVAHPIIEWGITMAGMSASHLELVDGREVVIAGITAPSLNIAQLSSLVFAMLGMAGLRTYEKRAGTAREK